MDMGRRGLDPLTFCVSSKGNRAKPGEYGGSVGPTAPSETIPKLPQFEGSRFLEWGEEKNGAFEGGSSDSPSIHELLGRPQMTRRASWQPKQRIRAPTIEPSTAPWEGPVGRPDAPGAG